MMNEARPDKTPGSDAARADRILNGLNGDYIIAEGIPANLAELLTAQTLALLAINETLGRVATMVEASVAMLFDEGRAVNVSTRSGQ